MTFRKAAFFIVITTLLLCIKASVSFGKLKVIYETDMDTDVDDAAALAMLHALADNEEVELLAVMHNTSDDFGPGYIDAINSYYNRPDLPIGSYKRDDTYSRDIATLLNCCPEFTRPIVLDPFFEGDVRTRADVADSHQLYIDILQGVPESSVTIISVGYMLNLEYLIKDPVGLELVRRKVKELVVFGGGWMPQDERHVLKMNLGGQQINHTAGMAAMHVFEHWPTPIHVNANRISKEYYQGERLKETPKNNPVREAYRIYRHNKEHWNRHLADMSAAYYAVFRNRKPEYWTLGSRGTPRVGCTRDPIIHFYSIWDTAEDSQHVHWSVNPGKFEEISEHIEDLFVQPPALKD